MGVFCSPGRGGVDGGREKRTCARWLMRSGEGGVRWDGAGVGAIVGDEGQE